MNRSKLLQSVIADLDARERVGKAKYGTTMDREDLTHEEWLRHAYEEHADAMLYLKKAMNTRNEAEKRIVREIEKLSKFQAKGPAPRLDRCAWFERRGKLLGLGLALAIVRGVK